MTNSEVKMIGFINTIAVIIGATLIGYEFGWVIGTGIGFLAYAFLPVNEATSWG